jgi:MFS family permease
MAESVPPQALAAQRANKRIYYHLYAAQALALVSTGMATVALALLAYQLAGGDAGAVLGTALAIKVATYVVVTPVAAAFVERLPRRALMVCLDLIRAAVVLTLPFVTQVWEIYVLIFVFQAASAAFTPTYQATVPDLLRDEKEYTKSLTRTRLAYELEGLVSPALAAGLLLLVSFRGLFVSTMIGLLISAALILRVTLPDPTRRSRAGVMQRTTRGVRLFLATPPLRGLLALNLAVAAATAMVTVNTVVLVQAWLGLSERATALALVAFGVGSVAGAIAVPRLVAARSYRATMLAGGSIAAAGLLLGILVPGYLILLALWFGLGLGCALATTAAGNLLVRSAAPVDRQPAYAAQFALSHACLLITYPLAGWLGASAGLKIDFAVLGLIAAVAVALAVRSWPPQGRRTVENTDVTPDDCHSGIHTSISPGSRLSQR